MSPRSTVVPWTVPQHADDMLPMRNGSLRAVLECTAPSAATDELVAVLSLLPHATQVVMRARRATISDDASVWYRLRASQASLLSELTGGPPAFVRRVLVTIPWDVREGGDGPTMLGARVGEARRRLDRERLATTSLRGPELAAIAAIEVVHEGRCEVRTGDRLVRTLIVTGPHERLQVHELDAIDCDHDLSLHIRPVGGSRLIELGACMTLWADTRGALDAATERTETLLRVQGVRLRRPYLQALPALMSGMPLGLDVANVVRVLPRPNEVERADDHPLLYGADPGTRRPLTLDRLALPNANAVVLGRPGDRFRVLALELIRARLDGLEVHVIDAAGRYAPVVDALEGRAIAPGAFDVFTVPKGPSGDLESRIRVVVALIELMAGDLKPAVLGAVEDAVAYVFAAHGYTHDGGGGDPPTLNEITAALERHEHGTDDAASSELRLLVQRLERGEPATVGRLLERRSSPPSLGPLSVHNLAASPPDVRPAAGLLSLDRLWRYAYNDRQVLLLDGVDEMLGGTAAEIVAGLMAASATRRTGLTVATADVIAILGGPLRKAALEAGIKVLLGQEPATMQPLAEAFRLTPAEQAWLLGAAPEEGLLLAGGRRLAFRAVASDEEERLISGGTR